MPSRSIPVSPTADRRPLGRTARLWARVRPFGADERGAFIVEFALVAFPLLFMIFAILELAMVFIVSSSLQNATLDGARTIRTGAVQSSGTATAATFRNAICDKLQWLASQCRTNLSVDVRTFDQFQNQNAPDPVSSGNFNQAALTFSPGAQGDIVLVRAFYRWKLLTPMLIGGLQRLSGGVTVLTASATFRNEPY